MEGEGPREAGLAKKGEVGAENPISSILIARTALQEDSEAVPPNKHRVKQLLEKQVQSEHFLFFPWGRPNIGAHMQKLNSPGLIFIINMFKISSCLLLGRRSFSVYDTPKTTIYVQGVFCLESGIPEVAWQVKPLVACFLVSLEACFKSWITGGMHTGIFFF